jgi:hypothetical protein
MGRKFTRPGAGGNLRLDTQQRREATFILNND